MTCGLESRGSSPVSPPRSAPCARSLSASDPLQFLGYTSYQAKSTFSKMRPKPFPPSLPPQFPGASLVSSSPSQSERVLSESLENYHTESRANKLMNASASYSLPTPLPLASSLQRGGEARAGCAE